ncbi:E3 ubiquitin-protein ligase RNF213-like, partial [Saccostrea cucullata]|uniref:E3 ubiquitin-protein ligase RNF213-like n=1 Tax=Saccostrea cuccullata TaxID=36930 RepID=UPI002ED231E1
MTFENDNLPNEDAIHTLLEFVISEENKTSVKGDAVVSRNRLRLRSAVKRPYDTCTTPVTRSFLLQLLLRTRDNSVNEHIEKFMRDTRGACRTNETLVKTCQMFIHCIEETTVYHFLKDLKTTKDEISEAEKFVQSATGLFNEQLSFKSLSRVAEVRWAIQIASKYVYRCMVEEVVSAREIDSLLRAIKDVCNKEDRDQNIRYFFVQELCKTHGESAFHDIVTKSKLKASQLPLSWLDVGIKRELLKNISNNKIADYIKIRPGDDMQEQNTKCLLMHVFLTFYLLPHGDSLPKPLIDIAQCNVPLP